MSPQRIIGIVLLIVGIALFIVGMNASHSVADQMKNTFTGRFTQETSWYIFGGLALGLIGLLMTIFGVRGRDA
jgi:branched-subunit amino acid permease